jgi:phosphatidylserine/phosphatidylglycerophosphate/cardiolipin synthase-like enzyme
MVEWYVLGAGAFVGGVLVHLGHRAVAGLRTWFSGHPAVRAHFSPRGGCTQAIVAELTAARREILVQAYSFTSSEIAAALIAAAGRGVRVAVLLDKSNEAETRSELGDLTTHGIDVRIDPCHAIAHNKVMVIDGRTVLTGSFNFTHQAEHENAENLLVLRDHFDLATLYRDNFHSHADHCVAPGAATPHPARPRKAG